MTTATEPAMRLAITLDLGRPPKSTNTSQIGAGWKAQRPGIKAARAAVARAWTAANPHGDFAQRPGERWRLVILWASPTPPKDPDNAHAALKPFVDACCQKVRRKVNGALQSIQGDAPILVDDSTEHLERVLEVVKCAEGAESLTFGFYCPVDRTQDAPSQTVADTYATDLEVIYDLASMPGGVTISRVKEALGLKAEPIGSMRDAVDHGVLRQDGLVWHAVQGPRPGEALQRADCYDLLTVDGQEEADERGLARELGIEDLDLTRDEVRESLARWHGNHPSAHALRDADDLLALSALGEVIEGLDAERLARLLRSVAIEPPALVEAQLGALKGWREKQDWGAPLPVKDPTLEPLLPQWMRGGEQLQLTELAGALPCYHVELRAAAAIDGLETALVLARHDADGSGELALAPLKGGQPAQRPILAHRRTLDDIRAMTLYETLSVQEQTDALEVWRAWMAGGKLMARTVADQLRAMEKQGPQLEKVTAARLELKAAESALKAAREEVKEAEAQLDIEHLQLEQICSDAQKNPGWPWETV